MNRYTHLKNTRYFSIVGWSGAGKTTLISGLIKEMGKRGLTVAAVKHAPEKYYLEPESKDSFCYLESGAKESFLVGKGEVINSRLISGEKDFFKKYKEKLDEFDIILCEGLVTGRSVIIEIFNSTLKNILKYEKSRLSAITGDRNIFKDMIFFHRDDISSIADFLLRDS